MAFKCAACGWDSEKNNIVGKDKKRRFEKCEVCGDTFCDDCLADMHRNLSNMGEADLTQIVGSGQSLLMGEGACPDCHAKD